MTFADLPAGERLFLDDKPGASSCHSRPEPHHPLPRREGRPVPENADLVLIPPTRRTP